MMSSLVYGVDICVLGGDVRVSTGRCFIFVMKYIKLTYIRAGIMFISFAVVECRYVIHWRRCRKMWAGGGRKVCRCLMCQSCEEGGMEWLKHGNIRVSDHTVQL